MSGVTSATTVASSAASTASTFSTITTALSAVAGVVGVIGKITQGQAAVQADNFNAGVAAQNSQIAADQGTMQLAQQQRLALQKLGAIKAAYGASGVTSAGSPLDVLADSYTQSELDANTIIYNSKAKAAGYQNTQALDIAKAQNDENATYVNAASSALLGAKDTLKAYDTVGTNS